MEKCTRQDVGGTSFNCSFLPRAEKEQDNYAEGIIIFKRVAPKGWTSPTPVGMAQGSGIRLHEARIRRGSVRIALPRLCYSTALSPLGLAGRVLKAFFLNLA